MTVKMVNKFDARVMFPRINKATMENIRDILDEYSFYAPHACVERALELGIKETEIRQGRPWLDRCFSLESIRKDAELHGVKMDELPFRRLIAIAK
jgi:hypothetical protein